MNSNDHLKNLLLKAGLSDTEADFYVFALENKGCSISDIYKKSELSKSSAYRAFESLKNLELLTTDSVNWKTNLSPLSLSGLIKKLENKQKSQKRVIDELKTLNSTRKISINSKITGIETLNGDEVFQKYLDLADADFNSLLVFGNWEDFNKKESLLPIERLFIKKRMKGGRGARACLTKTGPNTREVTDRDIDHHRITKLKEDKYIKPTWINAFEGNNLVYIWDIDEKGKTYATLIDSKSVANFYKDFIYSKTV